MSKIALLMSLALLCGCAEQRRQEPVAVKHPDCVNDTFNYDFYSNDDQTRLTYCYAVLQTIAKQKVGPQ